ncbi:DNA gyrase inhibitor YacG [Alphaproteobacteria bacterium]|nr:DNA gyrase inhibitor YacG [Alphaproteobacteria bacterium]
MEINSDFKNNVIKFNKKKALCPTCKKKSTKFFLPFCSKKCSDLDLLKWLSEDNPNNFSSDIKSHNK